MRSLRRTVERLCGAFARACERRAAAAERRASSFDALARMLAAAESRATRWELLDTAAELWEECERSTDDYLRPVPAAVPPTSNPDTMRLRAGDERRIAAQYRAVAASIRARSLGERHLACLRSLAGSLSVEDWAYALRPLGRALLEPILRAVAPDSLSLPAPAPPSKSPAGRRRAPTSAR